MTKDYSKMSPLDTVKVVVDGIDVDVTLGELAKVSFIIGRSTGRGEHKLWKTVKDLFEVDTYEHGDEINLPRVCYYDVQKQVEELYFNNYFKKDKLNAVKQKIESLSKVINDSERKLMDATSEIKKLRGEYDKLMQGFQ